MSAQRIPCGDAFVEICVDVLIQILLKTYGPDDRWQEDNLSCPKGKKQIYHDKISRFHNPIFLLENFSMFVISSKEAEPSVKSSEERERLNLAFHIPYDV